MQSLGDILKDAGHLPAVRTGRRCQPVRRHSRAVGREAGFWKKTSRPETRQIVLAARKYELATKQPGSRNGALGTVALEVIEYLAHLVDYRTGRLDPALETLMRRLKRSKDAIVRALKALRQHGFLDWIRRYVPTGSGGRGPQVQQTSNAYRMFLPKAAARLLGRYGQTPPLPDDFAHERQQRQAIIEEHRADLSMHDLALFDVGDNALGQALARLGKSLEERESAKRSESESKVL